jgi:CheY-like chemotaxis protein
MLEERMHTLVIAVPRSGLLVDGDAARLSQVVSNLLTNAAKYTPHGGRVSIGASREGGDVVLRVRDTGIGIAPEVLPRVFDLFVQGRQAIDREQGGLGLGLTIVRNLVERHGGHVTAESGGPGLGSEFVVHLPLVEAAAVSQAVAAPSVAREQVSYTISRILIVDDNEDAAEMVAMALQFRGFETRVAYDGPEALRVAAEFRPHAAFLDLGLPVMDGYELAARLKELPDLHRTRLIAVTGYGQDSDRRRTAEAGFHHHVVKPVDLDMLVTLVTAPPEGAMK